MILTVKYGVETLIDDSDYTKVSGFVWRVANTSGGKSYIVTNFNSRLRYLHRFIMQAKDGQHIDHINGNTYDNRRDNLRFATHAENTRNCSKCKTGRGSSKYKGVSLDKTKWRARITFNANTETIGYFKDEVEAANAYDKKAIELFGDFAKLNFPEGKC